ncbi:uncharacterized protein LOC106086756 [Stomoxys calcitrans]|uniref:Chitin-binding type-2 domain-containing protein n=1 Tax=Stomoxys calcitrans TaxID=35570 RepID=A0A1I8PHG9_STOCA|nr:uncharacterized protein LOC106086756 [Stomoxys calcitrans]
MKLCVAIAMLVIPTLASADIFSEYSSFLDPFASIQNPCHDIQNGQFICKDCATLAFCVQENGNWNSMDISTCDTGRDLYCDENVRGCVYKKECTGRGPKFECQNSGKFPDPYDCKQYHVCNETKHDERFVCPQGSAYSPATKSCSLSAHDDICYKAQYTCDNPWDMAAWPSDPNIYYICWYTTVDGEIVRYPLLHRCPDGHVFKGNACVPGGKADSDSQLPETSSSITPMSTTTPSTTRPTTTTAPWTTTTPSTTTPSTTTTMSTSCDLGSGLKANANDCYSYYVCTSGQLVSKTCPSGTYFNPTSLSCTLGGC